jgi:hypothetical protein
MPSIDLAPIETIVKTVLFTDPDLCTIHRKPQPGTTFDATVGVYRLPQPELIYGEPIQSLSGFRSGVCTFRDGMTGQAGRSEQGTVDATLTRWTVKIPLQAPVILIGDIVTLVLCRDVDWIGKRLVVRDVGGGTWKMTRALLCDRWAPGSAQDWLA